MKTDHPEKLRPVPAALPGYVLMVLQHFWLDDYGALRKGRTGDMIQMMADLGINDRAFTAHSERRRDDATRENGRAGLGAPSLALGNR